MHRPACKNVPLGALGADRELQVAAQPAEELTGPQLHTVFRTLARLMVRTSGQNGDAVANVHLSSRASGLTVAPVPSPHRCDAAT